MLFLIVFQTVCLNVKTSLKIIRQKTRLVFFSFQLSSPSHLRTATWTTNRSENSRNILEVVKVSMVEKKTWIICVMKVKRRITLLDVFPAFADYRQKNMLAWKCRRKAKCRSEKCSEYSTFFSQLIGLVWFIWAGVKAFYQILEGTKPLN